MTGSHMTSMRLITTKYFFTSAREAKGMRFNYTRDTAVCERQNLKVIDGINNCLLHMSCSERDYRAGQLPVPHG